MEFLEDPVLLRGKHEGRTVSLHVVGAVGKKGRLVDIELMESDSGMPVVAEAIYIGERERGSFRRLDVN